MGRYRMATHLSGRRREPAPRRWVHTRPSGPATQPRGGRLAPGGGPSELVVRRAALDGLGRQGSRRQSGTDTFGYFEHALNFRGPPGADPAGPTSQIGRPL